MSHPEFWRKKTAKQSNLCALFAERDIFKTHRHIENIVKSTLRYVFYVPMCLNYATGVVEHIDLTASQSFYAKIWDVSCFTLPLATIVWRVKTFFSNFPKVLNSEMTPC